MCDWYLFSYLKHFFHLIQTSISKGSFESHLTSRDFTPSGYQQEGSFESHHISSSHNTIFTQRSMDLLLSASILHTYDAVVFFKPPLYVFGRFLWKATCNWRPDNPLFLCLYKENVNFQEWFFTAKNHTNVDISWNQKHHHSIKRQFNTINDEELFNI